MLAPVNGTWGCLVDRCPKEPRSSHLTRAAVAPQACVLSGSVAVVPLTAEASGGAALLLTRAFAGSPERQSLASVK